MPVAELQRRMSAAEFGEWKAFYLLEGFGEIRAERRAGQICAEIHAVNGSAKAPADFMFDPDHHTQSEGGLTGDALEKVFEGMAAKLKDANA